MKTVLAVLTSYSLDRHDPGLGDSLARQMRTDGHRVIVLAFRTRTQAVRDEVEDDEGVDLISLRTDWPIVKYVLAWPAMIAAALRLRLRYGHRAFDYLVVQAPMAVRAPLLLLLYLFSFERRTAIVFDIFPIHQVRVRALPSLLHRPLRSLESALLRRFDVVTAMGKRNREVVSSYYAWRNRSPEVRIVRPWSADSTINPRFARRPSDDAPIRLVFGGQIVPGRRVDRLIQFLDMVRIDGVPLHLEIFGWGSGYGELQARMSRSDWVHFRGRVSRERYLTELTRFDVGCIVTDDRAGLPALPSKIADYSKVGLPSFCLVESESELFTVAEGLSCVHLNTFDFSTGAVASGREFLGSVRSPLVIDEAFAFAQTFSAAHAAAEIMR